MSRDDKARELFQRLAQTALPMGVYLLAADARFLECNADARQILGLPLEGPLDASLDDLLRDPAERAAFWRRLQAGMRSDRRVAGDILHLYNEGGDFFVRHSTRPLRDPDSGEVVGFVGCIVDVTPEERFHQLSNHLPVGVYRLDWDDRIVYANEALVGILGYSSREEVEGRRAREFYAYPDEADAFKEEVCSQGTVVKRVINMVKKSGEFFFSSISSAAIFGPDGCYEGREGTLVDATQEERYRRSINDVPVGFYEVHVEGGVDIIRQCNPEFAEMFEFPSVEQVIGVPIRDLYASAPDYLRFKNAIGAKDRAGLHLLGYPLRVKTRGGREFVIEVNSRLLKDRDGQIIGRTGVVRDISDEERLKAEMHSLQSDIGRVLHDYASTLFMVAHRVAPAIQALGPDPFDGARQPSIVEVEEALRGPATRTAASVDRLIRAAQGGAEERGISKVDWRNLLSHVGILRNYWEIEVAEFRPPVLRRAARCIIDLVNTALRGKMPQELLRQVIREAAELERIACVADLHYVQAEVISMDSQVRALRDVVTTGARLKAPPRIVALWDVVAQALSNLEEFSRSRGVAFRARDESRGARVKAVRRDLLRALTNILHNAIKYSWSREKGTAPWVSVRVYADSSRVNAEFENYGVPIPRDEVDEELIFQLGYRGRLSTDRGRLGTGIGLTDARDTARLSGGDVVVTSRPAWPSSAPDDYTVPYITTVTLWLPPHSRRGRSR